MQCVNKSRNMATTGLGKGMLKFIQALNSHWNQKRGPGFRVSADIKNRQNSKDQGGESYNKVVTNKTRTEF